jgi:hypothetical protein
MDLFHNKTQYDIDCKIISNSTTYLTYKFLSRGYDNLTTYGGEIVTVLEGKNLSFRYLNPVMKMNDFQLNFLGVDLSGLDMQGSSQSITLTNTKFSNIVLI